MTQAMPRLHPTLTEDYPVDAIEFFSPEARDRIQKRLFMGRSEPRESEDRELDAIAIACWLYAHDDDFKHATANEQKRSAQRVLRAAKNLDKALELTDRDTERRLALALGDRPRAIEQDDQRDGQRTYRALRQRMGNVKLSMFWTKIDTIIHACTVAAKPDTPSTKRAGRQAEQTPRLVRDLCHVLAEKWCRIQGTEFQASNKRTLKESKRKAQHGAKFLNCVLDELVIVLAERGQYLPANLNRVRLYIEVRDERKDAGKLSIAERKAYGRAAETRNMRSWDR